MAKTKKSSLVKRNLQSDGLFLLKLTLLLILGSQWLYIFTSDVNGQIPIPIGAIIGILFILKDPRAGDRKISYALLLTAMLIGFWMPTGITFLT